MLPMPLPLLTCGVSLLPDWFIAVVPSQRPALFVPPALRGYRHLVDGLPRSAPMPATISAERMGRLAGG
jgi:hypothetical protein